VKDGLARVKKIVGMSGRCDYLESAERKLIRRIKAFHDLQDNVRGQRLAMVADGAIQGLQPKSCQIVKTVKHETAA
jgi:hypothetical protein